MELQGVDDPDMVKPCMNWYNTVSWTEPFYKRSYLRDAICQNHSLLTKIGCRDIMLLNKSSVSLDDILLMF